MDEKFDKLDDFMAEHKDEFDQFEPPASLWDSINEQIAEPVQIKPEKEKSKIIPLFRKVAIHASTAAAVFLIMFFYYNSEEAVTETTVAQSEEVVAPEHIIDQIAPDFEETEAYFQVQLTRKVNKVSEYAEQYPEVYDDIIADLEELQVEYESLKIDLNDNMANQEIIESMIQNYQIRLEILENLLDKLQEHESDNTPNEI